MTITSYITDYNTDTHKKDYYILNETNSHALPVSLEEISGYTNRDIAKLLEQSGQPIITNNSDDIRIGGMRLSNPTLIHRSDNQQHVTELLSMVQENDLLNSYILDKRSNTSLEIHTWGSLLFAQKTYFSRYS